MVRTLLTSLYLAIATPVLGGAVILAALVRRPDRPGSIFDWAPRLWCRGLLWAAGIRVHVRHAERLADQPRIYVSNHVSWFDVPALAQLVPRLKFVAKAELFRVPIFGAAMRAAGMIPIERENRSAAFDSYAAAAARIRDGVSVVVYPEATRGETYLLRSFKKGPFVLAISAGVPIVPIVVHGTMEALPRGSWTIRPRTVELSVLEEVPTSGFTYGDRDRLSGMVRERMAAALKSEFGVVGELVSVPALAETTVS